MKLWLLSRGGELKEVEATRTTDKCFWYMGNYFGKTEERRQLRVTEYETAHESRELAVGARLAKLNSEMLQAESRLEDAKKELADFVKEEGLTL